MNYNLDFEKPLNNTNSCSSSGCNSGGCNKMEVFDWLSEMPLPSGVKPSPFVEVSFDQGSRKEFYKSSANISVIKGNWVVVEGSIGFDIGQVNLTGELVKFQMKKYAIQNNTITKRILRIASPEDMKLYHESKKQEKELLIRSRTIAKELKLDLKMSMVELQADSKKATFYYIAEHRIDFRELIKIYASEFKVKIDMRQIGARQESAKLGGIGSCGRELCSSTWLSDFKTVNTTAARYQSLSINQSKLSGQCGRLKCCLNFELDTYLDALQNFPKNADTLYFEQGKAKLVKKDIFKNIMWYSLEGSSKQYPLNVIKVKEILEQNKQGVKNIELVPSEIVSRINKEVTTVDMGFVNDVGQINLNNLDRKKQKNQKHKTKHTSSANKPSDNVNAGNTNQDLPSNSKNNKQQQQKNGNNKTVNNNAQNINKEKLSVDNKQTKKKYNNNKKNTPKQSPNEQQVSKEEKQ